MKKINDAEVLRMKSQGAKNREIAEKFCVSVDCIKQFLRRYKKKQGTTNIVQETDKEKLNALRKEYKNQKKYTIYAVLMNGEPVYVGKTAQTLSERFIKHCSNKESAVYPLIKKYGKENFSIETLAIAYDEEQAAMLEDKWTIYLFDDNYKLSNKQIGNHGYYVGISKQSRENIDEWLNDKIDNGRYEELKKKYDELKKEFLKVKEIGKQLYEFYKSSNEIIGNLKQELENERGEKNNILRRIMFNVSDDYLKKELERRKEIYDGWAKFN